MDKDQAPQVELSGELTPTSEERPALSMCDRLGPVVDEDDDDMQLQMFRTFSDPGRKKSLKSLEIPLDNLLSGIIFLSGGRDKQGCPLISLTQPQNQQVDMLIEISVQEIIDMLAYFTSVPNEESRSQGFVVLLDGDIIHDFLLKTMVKALSLIQDEDEPFREVFFISKSRDLTMIDWKLECDGENIDLPFHQVSDTTELLEFIERSQLTAEFKGDLSYNHQEWVRFRMQVEPFLCDCISISKRLARAIEPFTDDEVPKTVEQAKQSLHKHKLVKRKTLDELHIDELASEGSRINTQMVCVRKMSVNPDVTNTVETIQRLLSQIELVKGRMVSLWSSRNDKLQANLKQRIFEKEATQLIEWFEEYAEEFFQTHTELGESLDVAETLVAELKQFESSTQQIIGRVDGIVQSGSELEQNPHTDQQTVHGLMGKIQTFMNDFDIKLTKRKRKLSDSVRLHKLIEAALTWSIEGAVVLSETNGINPIEAKESVGQFLSAHPQPSEESVKELSDLSERAESTWIRDTGVFACNRVTEISERIAYHRELLEDMVLKEKERRQSKELLSDTRETEGYSPDGEIDFTAPRLVHQGSATSGGSLHYDDTGVDKALLLLQSVGTAAQTASDRIDAGSLPSSPVSRESIDYPGSPDGKKISLVEMLEEMETLDHPAKQRHHLTKRDISFPTATSGPTFVEGEFEESPKRRVQSFPCVEEQEQNLSVQTKNAKHRRKLMEELIQTEMTYVRDLEWVVREYLPAMDNLDDLPRNLIGKRNLIFSNITHLLEFNRQVILPSLESCRKCPIKLGQIFLSFEEDLLNYSVYFKNLPQQTKLMEDGGNKFFASVSQRLSDNFTLGSYLIKPFQRMARYKLFLEDLIKHSAKSDLAGKLKDYYDKLKEAQKMTDFILRNGNDLLAVECLKGFTDGGLGEQGKILRQGDLTLVEMTKHRRRVFLFETTIILSKRKKTKHSKDVPGSEIFEYKGHYKTKNFVLRENVDGHPTRFALHGKKATLFFQADTLEQKNLWVQDIWDLFFSHMLQLKDKNLEQHGSRPLTSIMAAGPGRTATIGRSFGHSIRHAMSMRYRTSLDFPRSRPSRPGSTVSITSNVSEVSTTSSIFTDDTTSQTSRNYSPGSPHSFVDLRARSASQITDPEFWSGREKTVSFARTSSGSTITNSSMQSPDPEDTLRENRRSQLVVEVHKLPEGSSPIPPTSSSSGGSQDSDPDFIFESPI